MHRSLLKVQRALHHVKRSVVEFIRRGFTGRPVAVAATAGAFGIALFFAAGWTAYVAYDLTAGLPTREQLRGIGDMAQATTIFDSNDRPAFTIFKEQRIEVPLDTDVAQLDQGGRLGRGSALLRPQRRRRHPRRRRRRAQPRGGPPRRRRQHDHAAARPPDASSAAARPTAASCRRSSSPRTSRISTRRTRSSSCT